MRFLLDTHVWIWLVERPRRLTERVRAVVDDFANYPLGLSAISPWEVAKKASKGRLELSVPLDEWMARAIEETFISVLPLTPEISVESCRLPGDFHQDPADQIIAATARIHDLVLMSSDKRLLGYNHVRTAWN